MFEKLVDIICDKMAESLDSDPTITQAKGTRLTDGSSGGTGAKVGQACNC